jgi:hypothetical protein
LADRSITIQESILSGRLLSVLHSKEVSVNPRDSFHSSIEGFRKHVDTEDPHVETLAVRLQEWRMKRNESLHSICRHIDDPYDEDTINKFELKLVETAREGRVLDDDLRNTVARIKRKMKHKANSAEA